MEAVEPVADDEASAFGTVELQGKEFRVTEFGAIDVMEFASIAAGADDMDLMQAMVAAYTFLEICIDPRDWQAFKRHARATKADLEQLMDVAAKCMGKLEGDTRPTGRSSDSSDGPRTIEPNSTVASSGQATALRVIDDLNSQGRPDLALFVRKRQRELGVLPEVSTVSA